MVVNAGSVIAQQNGLGRIEGVVTDAETGKAIEGATVILVGTGMGISTKSDGTFSLDKVPSGVYDISCGCVGYETVKERSEEVHGGASIMFRFRLTPEPIRMSEVLVSPSSFSFSASKGFTYQMSFQELKKLPNPTDDIFRSVQVLAGVTTDNLNAQFSVRGQDFQDMLTLIDGLEIYEPFHLKNPMGGDFQFNGGVGIVGQNMVKSVDLSLGGFPARYGNKDAGVFNIITKDPQGDTLHGSVNLDFTTSALTLQKTFGNQGFFLSARRGNYDILMKLLGYGTNGVPDYYDLFAKYVYRPSEEDNFFVDFLHSSDNLTFQDSYQPSITAQWISDYNNYLWAAWNHRNGRFSDQTILFGTLTPSQYIWNENEPPGTNFGNEGEKSYTFGLKSNLTFDVTETSSLEAGVELRRAANRGTFFRVAQDTLYYPTGTDTVQAGLNILGYDLGSYVLYKFGALDNFATLDCGLRFDYQSYIKRGNKQLSPRLALALRLPFRTTVRLAYGDYYEPPDVTNLESLTPDLRISSAVHYIIGLDNNFLKGTNIRLEAYYKRLSPSADSIYSYSRFFPLSYGYSQGVDLIIQYNASPLTIWVNYSYGLAKDVATNGMQFYRDMDRRDFFSVVGDYQIGSWDFSIVGRYMTGLPYTYFYWTKTKKGNQYYWVEGSGHQYNGARTDSYSDIDIRASKWFHLPYGKLLVKLEIMNLLNSRSLYEQRWDWVSDGVGGFMPVQDNFYTLPLIPSFGIRWEF